MAKRNANVDLFRIIATFFVIMLHVLGQGGILKGASPDGAHFWAAWSLETLAYCAVNCFALISGYIMADRDVKLKNVIGLWLQVLFYSLLISLVFFVVMPETKTTANYVNAVLPILRRRWWYASSYFGLFFFMPFLNAAIKHISQQTYRKTLLAILIGICCFCCIKHNDGFTLKNGYSTIWLAILYLFGAYIKKYDISQKTTAVKCILGFFGVIILSVLCKFVIRRLPAGGWNEIFVENMLISYTSITIVFAAIFLFLFCLRIKISDWVAKVINVFSPTTLGVYLIHVHPFVYNTVLKNAFVGFIEKPVMIMVLYVLLTALAIFLVCAIVELLRIQIFKLFRIGKLCEWIDRKINKPHKELSASK